MSEEKTDRNKEILQAFEDKHGKLTYRDLAKKYELSHNTIARIIYRMRIKRALSKLKEE